MSTRLPTTPTSKNQRFLRWVEKVGLEKEANGGKQQKDIWYPRDVNKTGEDSLPNHWRIGAPKKAEKLLGKHPTQPLELLDRIVRCSSHNGDVVIDQT